MTKQEMMENQEAVKTGFLYNRVNELASSIAMDIIADYALVNDLEENEELNLAYDFASERWYLYRHKKPEYVEELKSYGVDEDELKDIEIEAIQYLIEHIDLVVMMTRDWCDDETLSTLDRRYIFNPDIVFEFLEKKKKTALK